VVLDTGQVEISESVTVNLVLPYHSIPF